MLSQYSLEKNINILLKTTVFKEKTLGLVLSLIVKPSIEKKIKIVLSVQSVHSFEKIYHTDIVKSLIFCLVGVTVRLV